MRKSKWQQILVIIAVTLLMGYSSYADKTIRIRGGTWLDWEDKKGRLWYSGQKTDQAWGGYIEKRPTIVKPNAEAGQGILSKESQKLVQDAGYDLEMMKQGSGLGERMDEAIKYKVNTGESGKFDVNLIIAEYWIDHGLRNQKNEKGRAFGVKIAGRDVALRFIGPKKNEAMIATFKNNKVSHGRTSMEIHLIRLGDEGSRPIYMGLEIYPSGADPRLVDVQDKLTTTWGQIKSNH